MAATVSAWGKPGAWALDAEENESELLQQSKDDSSAAYGGETADYPSLAAVSSSKTKKKKPQTLSLKEFSAYSAGKPKGLTRDEQSALPTGPRERSAEELDRSKLGGGFRSYGGGARDEQPRRQGSFNRESSHEFAPSRADETDDWGANKKSSANSGFERRERGERGGFFGDTQSRADEVDNWASNKNLAASEPRRYEKRGGFGLESSDGGSDSGNWGKRKEEEGRRSGGAFDSLRERRGGTESNEGESESWGRKREESSGGNRPRLNLQPRTLPVNEEAKSEDAPSVVKPKGSNPFSEARPREEPRMLPVNEEAKSEDAPSVVKPKGSNPFGEARPREEPRMLPVNEEAKREDAPSVVKPKGSNPFGEARPREEVLKEKAQDCKEIEEKLEFVKVNDVASAGAVDGDAIPQRSVWSGRERMHPEDKAEKSWRKLKSVDPPQSGGETENGHADIENTENKDSQI